MTRRSACRAWALTAPWITALDRGPSGQPLNVVAAVLNPKPLMVLSSIRVRKVPSVPIESRAVSSTTMSFGGCTATPGR